MDITLYKTQVQEWIREVNEFRGRNPQRVLNACDKIEEYGRQINDDALIGYVSFSRGETYYLLNDMKGFYSQMLRCLEPLERIQEWGYLVMANNMLGIMSLNRGNAPFAMDYYIKALNYCQKYSLPDIEWIVHMNVGTLYLHVEEYARALDHFQIAYRYINDHTTSPDYKNNLNAVYLGISKAYLKMMNDIRAEEYYNLIERECLSELSLFEKLAVYCLRARILFSQRNMEAVDKMIESIGQMCNTDIPIMDLFDDMYEYMEMLLDIEKDNEFFNIYSIVEELIKKTTIKYLEKKLLTLKIRYYRKNNLVEDYKKASCLFYELSEITEKDNRLMVNNMIVMRHSFNELSEINKRTEEENEALHRKSETDPLTTLYNRFKFNDYKTKAFSKAFKSQTAFAIEILDIDYFKQFNDNYGHQKGDECIKFIANALLKLHSLRKSDNENIFVSRYGGDEFVVIYEGYTRAEVVTLTETLRHMILEGALEHKYSLAADVVTISQGVCWGVPRTTDSVDDFLHTADLMLYKVKEISRNSIKVGDIGDS